MALSPTLSQGNLFYTTIMVSCLLLTAAILGLFGWDFFDRTHKPAPFYFAVSEENPSRRLRALRLPNLTTRALLSWAAEAATAAYNFDFYNYNTILKNIRPYFTGSGYDNFLAALNNAGTLAKIREKKLVLSSVLTAYPVIIKEGLIVANTYGWQVQFPMLLTFQSASEQQKINIVVTLTIVRVPTTESSKGIGINSFLVQNYSRQN